MYKIYYFDENWGTKGMRIANNNTEYLYLLHTLPKNGFVIERVEEVKITATSRR